MSTLVSLQTCTTVEKPSQWSSPRPSHVPTVAGWATQRSPCRSTWLQSTQRPPQKWYVCAGVWHLTIYKTFTWFLQMRTDLTSGNISICVAFPHIPQIFFLKWQTESGHCRFSMCAVVCLPPLLCLIVQPSSWCQLLTLQGKLKYQWCQVVVCADLFIDVHCFSFDSR